MRTRVDRGRTGEPAVGTGRPTSHMTISDDWSLCVHVYGRRVSNPTTPRDDGNPKGSHKSPSGARVRRGSPGSSDPSPVEPQEGVVSSFR